METRGDEMTVALVARPLGDFMTLDHFLYRSKIRFTLSVIAGLLIKPMGYRFDKSWRQADGGFRGAFYMICSTVAANYIADSPITQIKHWSKYV
jgi:hypothetical protein